MEVPSLHDGCPTALPLSILNCVCFVHKFIVDGVAGVIIAVAAAVVVAAIFVAFSVAIVVTAIVAFAVAVVVAYAVAVVIKFAFTAIAAVFVINVVTAAVAFQGVVHDDDGGGSSGDGRWGRTLAEEE